MGGLGPGDSGEAAPALRSLEPEARGGLVGCSGLGIYRAALATLLPSLATPLPRKERELSFCEEFGTGSGGGGGKVISGCY